MENRLPDCERARIDDTKLYDYLLNLNHPDGKSKARFFELIGYTTNNRYAGVGEQLRADLLQLACSGTVVSEFPNRVGCKYVVVGPINAPNNRTYQLLTVWIIESRQGNVPSNEPRLITAYPND